MRVIRETISVTELHEMSHKMFGGIVKAAADVTLSLTERRMQETFAGQAFERALELLDLTLQAQSSRMCSSVLWIHLSIIYNLDIEQLGRCIFQAYCRWHTFCIPVRLYKIWACLTLLPYLKSIGLYG